MHGRIRFGILCGALLLCLLTQRAAGAFVCSTPEETGPADSVYVAGNPDWYPIEYYNPDTKSYEGILPEILERIGERTGLSFTYVLAGTEDQRLRLAKNGQVEMVSGYARNAEELRRYSMTGSSVLLTLPENEETIEVCFAFTDIAGEQLVRTIERALAGLSEQEITEIAVGFVMQHTAEHTPKWIVPVCLGALALLAALAAVLAVSRRRYKKAAEHSDRYDLVTGIGNKAYFAELFEKYIPDRYRGIYCVIFIGFDIARVNQYYGEAAAEEQLCFAANELIKNISDNEIAARVSGGGFAVARPGSGEREAEAWTKKLLLALNRYSEKYGKDYRPMFRAGIYMLQPADRDCESVLFNARQGYQQAVSGGVELAFSRLEQISSEKEELRLKKQMLDAVQNREFKMFLQFIVGAEDGKIQGAEALSRWEHPQKGLLYPGRYIELMEAEGTIGELDFYIFEQACGQLERWQKQGIDIGISCNFARITLDRKDFISQIEEIAGRYFFRRSALIMEITEDTMEKNKKAAFENVSRCRELGFRIALDDVGSGYTSFADLRDYPIDIVKIDRSILNAAVNARGIALLEGMIALAHSLQMQVLCEGMETAQQDELLRRLNCDFMQGYFYYRALPAGEADHFLAENGEKFRERHGG